MSHTTARRWAAAIAGVVAIGIAAGVALLSVRYLDSTAAVPRPSASAAVAVAAGSLPRRAAFLGDSITVGNSDLDAGRIGTLSWFHDLVAGDAPILEYAGAAAENGRDTTWMAAHVDGALAGRPEVLFVLGGTNDLAAGAPVETTLANLAAIADAAGAAGVRVALVTVPPLDAGVDPATVLALNDGIRNLAAERGAYLVDAAEAVTGPEGEWLPSMTTDGIHPSAGGAALMSAAAERALTGG